MWKRLLGEGTTTRYEERRKGKQAVKLGDGAESFKYMGGC
jgi:hypothetical protein